MENEGKNKDGRYKDTKKSRNRVKYKSIRKMKRKMFCGTSSHDIPKGSEDLDVFQGDNMPTSVDDDQCGCLPVWMMRKCQQAPDAFQQWKRSYPFCHECKKNCKCHSGMEGQTC